MTAPNWQRVKDVFQDTLARAREERAAFLDEACAADTELRREVESLLDSHQEAGGFLSAARLARRPPPQSRRHSPRRGASGPTACSGVIAHGGMGTVYRAVRDDDTFQKTVALKLVRAGAASEYVERRFLQERRILARLQHPNIAAILDGGTTEEGHPYLVMEHVEGHRSHRLLRRPGASARASGWRCSGPCAARSTTPTRTSSSIAT